MGSIYMNIIFGDIIYPNIIDILKNIKYNKKYRLSNMDIKNGTINNKYHKICKNMYINHLKNRHIIEYYNYINEMIKLLKSKSLIYMYNKLLNIK